MRPVYMESFGDCLAACVATILEIELAECPVIPTGIEQFYAECKRDKIAVELTMDEYYRDPSRLHGTEWYRRYCAWIDANKERHTAEISKAWGTWLEQRGLELLTFPPTEKIAGYSIANCYHGSHTHALVLLDGAIVHDPERGFGPDNMEFPWKIRCIHILKTKEK